MGCNDRGSNFNAHVWIDGQWRSQWGEPSFQAPTRELVAGQVAQTSYPEEWYVYQDSSTGQWHGRLIQTEVSYHLTYEQTACTDDGGREHRLDWKSHETSLPAGNDEAALTAMRQFCTKPPTQCYCHTSQRRPYELTRQTTITGGAVDTLERVVIWPTKL